MAWTYTIVNQELDKNLSEVPIYTFTAVRVRKISKYQFGDLITRLNNFILLLLYRNSVLIASSVGTINLPKITKI